MKTPQLAILTLGLILGLTRGLPLAAAEAPAAAKASNIHQEILGQLEDAEKKLTALAEAIPAEKYSWRPAPGVRSISEAFAHVAAGNYFLLSTWGVKEPEGVDRRSFEKNVTEKPKVRAILKDSFAFAREQVAKTSDADLEKLVDFFGSKVTVRGIQLQMIAHAHEHLGQLIAYARSNNVTPPWSAGN